MKKYGKYEKRTEAAPVKPEKDKNPLLQTYFTSLLSLVLCVTMFFGTSYAWFSSEVQSTGNEIYVGILKVDLEKKVGSEWVSMSEVVTEGQASAKLYDGRIRWEPGYTSLETIRIVDKGDLAFNYTLTFTDGTIANAEGSAPYETAEAAASALTSAAKWFDIWTYYHAGNAAPTATSYADIQRTDSGWEYIGTLGEVLEGKAVLKGNMTDAAVSGETPLTHTYTVAMHMKGETTGSEEDERALNALMGQKLALTVKLVASQCSAEQDGFGTNHYDQVVSDAEQLRAAFSNGGTVALSADITAEDVTTLAAVPANKKVDLYLNGHSITATLAAQEGRSSELFYVYPGANLTIHADHTSTIHVVASKSEKTNAVINNCGGTVVINGGKYTMDYGTYGEGYVIPTVVDNNSTLGAATLVINGGTFTHTRNMFRNFANHATEEATIVINGGIFNGAVNDYAAIWNQKPSTAIPAGAGIVYLKGGNYNYVLVCTGFGTEQEDGSLTDTGVSVSNDVILGKWEKDDSEWNAEISRKAPQG